MPNTHLEGPAVMNSEFTACGLAFNAFESGDAEEPVVFAAAGTIFTCPTCRVVADYYRSFKGYRAP